MLRQALEAAPAGHYRQPFSVATPLLSLAVRLASVCKLWRQAAVQATAALDELELEFTSNMEPSFLSPLLAQLLQTRASLRMESTLLAAPEAPGFLQLARPRELALVECSSACQAVAANLACCTSLQQLHCYNSAVPLAYPPNLRKLRVDFCSSPLHGEATALLRRLRSLPRLTDLSVGLLSFADMPTRIPHLDALTSLTFRVELWPAVEPFSLEALQQAADEGISTALEVSLWESNDYHIDEGPSSSQPQTGRSFGLPWLRCQR